MKIVVADPNLVPRREWLEAAVGGQVHWYVAGTPLDELRDTDCMWAAGSPQRWRRLPRDCG